MEGGGRKEGGEGGREGGREGMREEGREGGRGEREVREGGRGGGGSEGRESREGGHVVKCIKVLAVCIQALPLSLPSPLLSSQHSPGMPWRSREERCHW